MKGIQVYRLGKANIYLTNVAGSEIFGYGFSRHEAILDLRLKLLTESQATRQP